MENIVNYRSCCMENVLSNIMEKIEETKAPDLAWHDLWSREGKIL